MNGGTKPMILVVEDEGVVAMDLVSSLEKLHYPVVGVAATGGEAISFAESKAPNLVLMDIHLRGDMDGITAAEHIQGKLSIPVIYLTAYSDDATLQRARVTHPFGYVLKPFDDREIDVAIQIALFRHDLEQALRDSQGRLEAILGGMAEAVLATDADQRVTFLNRAAEKLVGWSSTRAEGRLLSDVLTIRTGADGSQQLVRAGGFAIPVEIVESPVLDAAGKPTGYVTIARDVSERVGAQEAHDRELVQRAARAAAEKEHERTRLKGEISLALADLTQSADMKAAIKNVVELIASTLDTWCVLHIEDDEEPLRVTAHPDKESAVIAEEVVCRWPPDPHAARGSYAVMRSGRSELVEALNDDDLQGLAQSPEHLALLRRMRPTSYVCVPLLSRQRVIGALSFVSVADAPLYDEAALAFAQAIADRIALALDNARLYREARQAKAAAERLYLAEQSARAEAEALFRSADALTEAQLDLEAVVQRVTDEATRMVGAEFGAFFYNVVNDDGDAYRLYALSGAPREAFEKLGLPRSTPIFGPTFAGEGVVRVDDVRKDPRYGTMAPHYGMPKGHLPVTSYLAVPVVSRAGSVIGGLFFGHPEAGQFTEEHERMVRALAGHAAVAVDNARLFRSTREAEERQSRLVRELERAVRFSEMFIGILGHDLRNPLSGITTAAHLVMSRAESERLSRPAGRILSSAERMSRMIDQILDLTHVRLGRGLPLKRSNVSLEAICRLALEELKGDADSDAELRLEVKGDVRGSWDEDRLTQLISNLAGNAVQHRRPGTPVMVTVEGSAPDLVTVEVMNHGAIPMAILPTIFEPLHGGQHPRGEGSSGLGLGLYISKEIANAHGGSIRVESGPSSGTRFIVELPRDPPGQGGDVFLPKEDGAKRLRASQQCILIVEDDADIRESLRDAFEDEGYLVRCAANGREGLDAMQPPDLPNVIVLDLCMPVMDGLEMYAALQADAKLAKVPVVVSTSDPSRAPSGVLLMRKPIDLTTMLKTIEKLCGR